jgi:hypothetical protein
MKKLLSALLTLAMVLTLAIPPAIVNAHAAVVEGTGTLTITPSITSAKAGSDAIEVTYTIKVTPPTGKSVGFFSFTLNPPTGMTLATAKTDYAKNSDLLYNEDLSPDGIFETFNYTPTSGYFLASGTTTERNMTSEATVLTIKATIAAGTTGSLTLGATGFEIGPNGTDKYTAEVKTTPVEVYSELTGVQAVTLSGSPSKGGTVSAITASGPANTTATVEWYDDSTKFTGTTFAANTEYTAKVTLTPNTGYKFASDATYTLDGEAVTPTEGTDGAMILSKTFSKTDSRTLLTLAITNYTGGGKTDGDTVAKSELTVTATFDAGDADTAYTDYDVEYNTGTALKKGDTSFKVKKGTVKSAAYNISAVAGKTPTAGLFTFAAPSLTYTGADQQAAVKSAVTYTKTAEAGAATYSFQKKAGETWSAAEEVTAAGDYRILAAVAGGTEYADASGITVGEFTVAKAAQTATKPSIATYSDTAIAATAVTNQEYQIKKSGETAPTAASTGWDDSSSFTGLDCEHERRQGL